MLTGRLVRVRYGRQRIVPCYLNPHEPGWLETAARLLDLFRGQEGRTRGELEEEVRETFGSDLAQVVHQGLAKLLLDRCEFEVVAGQPPEQLREAVFQTAARSWTGPGARAATAAIEGATQDSLAFAPAAPFDREAVLREVADRLGLTPAQVDQGLFADLKSEQRLVRFRDISPERLLQRYNVALAQAVLLRSVRVSVRIQGESPQRLRQLFRQVKFHRLICEVERTGADGLCLHLDGPLSLFSATQKYGLQLGLFLPAVLLCQDYDLQADLRWGPQKKPRVFSLTPRDGLVSHLPDTGTYVPPELGMFAALFRKKVRGWDIAEETEVVALEDGFWVPDYRLVQRGSGRTVLLEVLGFWRRGGVERHLERLRRQAPVPFLLAVSEQLHIDEADLDGLPAAIHRFRHMPLPEEIANLAEGLVRAAPAPGPA